MLNADDPRVREMAGRTRARVLWFGRSASADIRADDETLDERGRAAFTLRTPSGSAPVRLRLYGRHTVGNALAAAAVAYELGLPVATIAEELSAAEPRSRWRLEVHDRPDGVTIVNDAYNANPDSMRAAFETLAVLGRNRRRFAVIAALRELGEDGPRLNEEVGRLAGEAGLELLVVVGEDAEPVLAGAGGARTAVVAPAEAGPPGATREVLHAPDVGAAVREVARRLQPGDVVLVKGPRAAGLERVAEALLAGPPPAAGPPGAVPQAPAGMPAGGDAR